MVYEMVPSFKTGAHLALFDKVNLIQIILLQSIESW